jgi:hypothetical protein
MVSELSDEATGSWNQQLIMQHFQAVDIPIIPSIPLRPSTEDFVAWHFDNRCLFSVKSSYKVHVDFERGFAVIQEGPRDKVQRVRL